MKRNGFLSAALLLHCLLLVQSAAAQEADPGQVSPVVIVPRVIGTQEWTSRC